MKQIALLGIILLLSGCGGFLPGISTPKPPDTVYNWHETVHTTPRLITSVDGKSYTADETTKELSVEYTKKEKPLSFLQKIGNWIAGLSWTAFILIGGCLLIFGSAPILWAYAKYQKIKTGLKEVVSGIEDSNKVQSDKDLHDALAKSTSDGTKKLIDDIKRE